MSEELINKIFDHLDEWRNFPAYQLERRADIFFAIYLEEILKHSHQANIDLIIPEFPVRKSSLSIEDDLKKKKTNLSYKIDYLAISNKNEKVYLIELKTDINSRNELQDNYLKETKNRNIPNLVKGVLQIYKASKSKNKYNNLLKQLVEVGWLDDTFKENLSANYDIEIIYIQPENKNNEKNVITFENIAQIISSKEDYLSKRFAISMRKWLKNPS